MRMFSGSDGWPEHEAHTTVYLLNKLWVDPLENRDAHGYEVVGVFLRQRQAELWVENNQEMWNKEKCWSLGEKGLPLYKITEVKVL